MSDAVTPKVSSEELERSFAYARQYYGEKSVAPGSAFGMLAKYRPEVFHGYITLRQAAYNTGPDAALSPKMKELIILAIAIAMKRTNPPPASHTRLAMEAGVTAAEVAEVVSLCLMLGGMVAYAESGMHALRAAEEFEAAKAKEVRTT